MKRVLYQALSDTSEQCKSRAPTSVCKTFSKRRIAESYRGASFMPRCALKNGLVTRYHPKNRSLTLIKINQIVCVKGSPSLLDRKFAWKGVVPVECPQHFEKGLHYANHRGIVLVPITSKPLVSVSLRWLYNTHVGQTREERPEFRARRRCVHQIFKLRQVLEHLSTFQRLTTTALLDVCTILVLLIGLFVEELSTWEAYVGHQRVIPSYARSG